MTFDRNWCQQVRQAGVVKVSQALGGLSARRGERGGFTPCPSCGADNRGKHDKRGPLGMTRDGGGWQCHRCQAKGDAVTLASFLSGERGVVNSAVRKACERAGLLMQVGTGHRPMQATTRSPAGITPSAKPCYPPAADLAAVVRQGYAINAASDGAARAWLRSRALDPDLVADSGILLALRADAKLPPWARCRGVSWPQSGHRLLAPLCDPQGALRSLHARQIDRETKEMPKGTNPAGFDIRGLVLACPVARRMLANGEKPPMVVIAEGLPDWLTWFQYHRERHDKVAVFGIVAGAWTQSFADKIVSGTRVVLAGHNDDAGRRYVESILKTFRDRAAKGQIELEKRSAA